MNPEGKTEKQMLTAIEKAASRYTQAALNFDIANDENWLEDIKKAKNVMKKNKNIIIEVARYLIDYFPPGYNWYDLGEKVGYNVFDMT